MNKTGYVGQYTNHSLRAITETRLYNEDVPEQLIKEQKGYRSNDIFDYKHPSDAYTSAVSSVRQQRSCIGAFHGSLTLTSYLTFSL
jgi:hypothetical protein